ncbi:hypothetical protein V7S43_015457 [Phytophthora oleae]|uniref:Uncharacterized protein n=1 Tax=Phytophthora oleae TaxID=2107226 RepID=A0ABD3EYV4_9STRA
MNLDADEIEEDGEKEALRVGMTFALGTDALHAVQDYALSQTKAVKVMQRSGVRRFIGCTSEGCTVFTYGSWHISSINPKHVNCVSSANPTRRQIAELPTFESAVRADGTVSARTLTEQIQSRDGISLVKKRRALYCAREEVNDIGVEALAKHYTKISGATYF